MCTIVCLSNSHIDFYVENIIGSDVLNHTIIYVKTKESSQLYFRISFFFLDFATKSIQIN